MRYNQCILNVENYVESWVENEGAIEQGGGKQTAQEDEKRFPISLL